MFEFHSEDIETDFRGIEHVTEKYYKKKNIKGGKTKRRKQKKRQHKKTSKKTSKKHQKKHKKNIKKNESNIIR